MAWGSGTGTGGAPREEPPRRPLRGIDTTKATSARVYNVLLDGKDHYAADREAAARVIQVAPQVRDAVRENRRFLQRAVHYLAAEQGIRQFIDMGTGLPTAGNVHEIAHQVDPEACVVYVDNDPIVLVHGRALLADNVTTVVVEADVRGPEDILNHPELLEVIDLGEPVAVLFVAILHFISDEEYPTGIVATVRDALPPGSFMVISHATPGRRAASSEEAARLYSESITPITLRSPAQVEAFFDGFELVPPGVVPAARWRPDLPSYVRRADRPGSAPVLGGVGRKS